MKEHYIGNTLQKNLLRSATVQRKLTSLLLIAIDYNLLGDFYFKTLINDFTNEKIGRCLSFQFNFYYLLLSFRMIIKNTLKRCWVSLDNHNKYL